MRPFLIPIVGAVLLAIGILLILINKELATTALVFQIAGVVLLGFYMVKEMLPGRSKRKR